MNENVSLNKAYEPLEIERKWHEYWMAHQIFKSEVNNQKTPFTIVIPPPNVTGILHMGHALNNTLQDILVRWKRMCGFETLWLPGTDHAGIATQNVVEKNLAKQGISRHQLGRERFVDTVWEWKEKYGGVIIQQLKNLGCSCDWDRERFTMDEGLSKAVQEVFIRLFEKGLIYKGKYIINWCPRCNTAISDEEVIHKDVGTSLWYIKYPIKDSDAFVMVATTRPETMLGDVAVAINPNDERYSWLIGKTVILPILNRSLTVIADDYVSKEFGTGIVKVTPAHDMNDFMMAQRHNLESIIVIDEQGAMNENAGPNYKGMDRFECRKQLVKDLEAQGYLERIEQYKYAIGHCYRCDTIVEPYLSNQWFVRMKPLAEPAIAPVRDGKIKFFPEHWTKVYLNWMENIRDWCISRQLWWGHRIPVWNCDACGFYGTFRSAPDTCPKCNKTGMRQEEDVLDTWFSSWLWPFSTLGWPEDTKDLRYYYPTDSLVTGSEIIFFWVARMIMAGLEFIHDIPFESVYINGTVRDEIGRKMSKSLGNSPDPNDMILEVGADALRFGMIMIAPRGQDIFFSKNSLQTGRAFANKLWNATRFILMNLDGEALPKPDITNPNATAADKWILSRLDHTISEVTIALEEFRLNDAARSIYSFVWSEFCDWYIEFSKPVLHGRIEKGSKELVKSILVYVMETAMRLLHPFMPFITEELWHHLPHQGETICRASYPKPGELHIELDAGISIIMDIINGVRTIRGEMNINPGIQMQVFVKSPNQEIADRILAETHYICELARIESLVLIDHPDKSRLLATTIINGIEIFVDLTGHVDVQAEINRLEKELAKVLTEMQKIKQKLDNQEFLAKAPEEVVFKNKMKHEELDNIQQKLEQSLSKMRSIIGHAK